MQPIKLIVCDLDNTLLDSNKEISNETVSALRACMERGMLFAFATARAQRTTRPYQQRTHPDYVIANNGASICRGGQIIRNRNMDIEMANDLLKSFLAEPGIGSITIDTDDRLLTNDMENWPSAEPKGQVAYCDYIDPLQRAVPKMTVACEDKKVAEGILARYPELQMLSYRGENWHTFMRKDSTKLNAIGWITEKEGIPLEQVVAFGDDAVDLEMIENCGIGVAMENAIPELKAAADDICGDNDHHGVARWIEANILNP